MRNIYLAVIAICLSVAGYSQTSTLLDSLGDGGFETSHLFPANGWTAVNDSDNMWVINDLTAPYSGGRSVYISNDGSNNAYTTTSARTSHFYRDVAIPAGASNIVLRFQWRGKGESGADRMFVSRATTTVTPVAHAPLSPSFSIGGGALTMWTQPSFTATTYTPATITLPNTVAGTTVRLIFSWQNNGSGGVNPPAVVDHISLTYTPACSGTPTAGSVSATVTSGCSGFTSALSLSGASTGGGVTYQWQSSPDSSTWTNIAFATGTTYSASVISSAYYRCVVTCPTSGSSVNTPSIFLATTTAPSADYASLPYTQNFEGTWVNACSTKDVPSTNWTNTPGTGNQSWRRSDDSLTPNTANWTSPQNGEYTPLASTGTNSARFHTYFAPSGSKGNLDLYINLSAGGTKQLSYDYINTSGSDKLVCKLSTDGGSTFTTIDSPASIATSWTTRTISLSATSSTSVIRFEATSDFGVTDIGLDNVSISTCSPAAIAGSLIICAGSTTTLTNTTSGGTWSSANPLTASVGATTGVVTGNAAGTATITYTLASGCYTTSVVTVGAQPATITGGTVMCAGSSSTLSSTTSGGFWSSNNTGIATIGSASGITAGISTGATTISYTLPTGCFRSISVSVMPVPAAITGTLMVDSNSTVTLSNTTPGGMWMSSNTSVATIGTSTGIVTGVNTGTATITYMLGTGCFTTTTITVYSSSSIPAASCTPSYYYAGEACSTHGINISNFVVTGMSGSTLTDPSSCTGTGYQSHLGLAVNMQQTGTYSATVYCSGSYSENVQVWIDFDNDGAFSIDERVGGMNSFTSAGGTFTLDIPYTAAPGIHRMRVLTSYYGTGYTYPDLDPCATGYYYGDSRDYTANIIPLTPCSGTPDGGTAISTPATSCSGGTFTLSPGASTLMGGLSYQWQSSADSTTWTNITAATNQTYTGSEGTTTFYRLITTCDNSGLSSNSSTATVLYTSGCYCTPSYYYGAPASVYQMANFSLSGHGGTTINDNGPATVPSGGYEDRTSIAITVQQNGSYSGSLTYTDNYLYYNTQAWIDYNDNGTFEPSEIVTPVIASGCSASTTFSTFTMNIPHTATLGLHRMRVRQGMSYSCATTPIMDPCNYSDGYVAYYYGMTRDYMATVVAMPACSGTPTPGSTVVSSSSTCSGSTTDLSIAGATIAGSLTFQWQSSPDSTSWTNISGATTEAYTASSSATTFYRRQLTCATSGVTVSSTPAKVFYTSGCVCTPSYYYGGTSYRMTRFNLTGDGSTSINDNGPTPSTSETYQNRTFISVDMRQGGAYTGTVTYSDNYTYYVNQVWVDYNDNGTFESTEVVTPVFGVNCSVSDTASGFTINLPATAVVGTHLMRVRQAMSWSCTVPTIMDPCYYYDGYVSYYYGRTRDYLVNILPCTSAPVAGTITGTAAFCQGTSSTLSAMPVGGSWSSSNSSVATVDASGYVNGIAAGTATISYTIANGCGSNSATRVVTINPLPNAGTITGADSVAVGSIITLTNPSADSGSWTSTSTAIAAIGSTGVVTPAMAGTTTISYTTTNGCGTVSTSKVITVTSAASAYCAPTYYYGYTGDYYSLANFTLYGDAGSTINDNGPAAIPYYYEDRSFISVNLRQGGAYNGAQTYTQYSNYYFNQVWIDFNDNHTFEASERVSKIYGDSACLYATSSSNFTLNLPAGATTGSHIMRVRQTYMSTCSTPSYIDPCYWYGDGYYYFGLARDYSVNILPCSSAPVVGTITGVAALCAGTTTTLAAMPTDGSWSSSNTSLASVGSTGVVNGIAAGTVTISYTVTNACGTNSATRVVTVNPLPVVGAITGPDSVVVGSMITLTNPTGDAGVWYSTVQTVATVDSFGHVAGILTGSTTISYTTTNACGTATTTKTVYVSSPASGYCVPYYYYGYDGNYYSMANFSLTGHSGSTINDDGPTVRPVSYEDRTFISVNLMPGSSYAGSETYTHNYYYYNTQVWIDFNDDNTFEASEAVTGVFGTGCYSPISSSSFALTIPATANPGTHIMRVRQTSSNGCSLSPAMNPCNYYDSYNNYYYGMTRDYKVNVLTPPPCSGAPDAGIATITNSYACSTTVETLNLTGATVASGLSYQWQSSAEGTYWTNISGATTYPYTFSGVGVTTYYRAIISCGASSDTSSTVLMTGTPCYCIPTYYYAVDACGYYHMDIANFLLNGEAGTSINDSAACNGTGYVQRMALSATLQQGSGYTAYISSSTPSYSQSVQVWIDFDNDGNFSSTESIGGYNYFLNSPTAFALTIPTGVANGNHRMRVRSYYYPYGSYPYLSPCDNTYYGDSRDYTVNITNSVACAGIPIPGTVNASVTTACTTYSSTLSLADSSASLPLGLAFQWQTSTDTATWSNITGATNTSYTATVSSTGYYRCTLTCSNSGMSASTPAKRLYIVAPPTISGTTTVCTGNYTGLSASPYGGTWSSLDTSVATVNVAGDVYGVAAGSAIISYNYSSSGAGCMTATTVNVMPLPTVYTVNGGGSYCSGGAGVNIGLSGSNTGVNYLLYYGPYYMATVSGTGSAISFGLQTNGGIYTVLAVNSATGCTRTMTGSATVSVDGVPGIAGVSAPCVGGTITLSNSAAGGVWSSTNTAVATIGATTGVVTTIAAGTTTISYVVSTGCFTTAVISVNTAPSAITGTASACVGSSTNLSTLTAGGTWSSSNTAVADVVYYSGTVYGIAPGTATISYSAGAGCVATRVVTINTLPVAITGSTNVCIGLTSTLSDSTSGGTWSSASTLTATVNSASGIVSGAGGGVTIITYMMPTGCYRTTLFTVNPLPAFINGTRKVCVGHVTNLSDITPAGTWSSSNSSIATVGTSGSVSGITPGTATITYRLSTGCVALAIITVNPLPVAITGTTGICVGGTTTLHNSSGSGTWASSTPSIATVGSATGTVTGLSAGSTTVTYTMNTGCWATTFVTVNGLPSAISGSLTTCIGNTTSLSSAPGGGSWSSGSADASIDSFLGVVTGMNSGTARVTYTLGTGCRTTAVVTVNSLPSVISGTMSTCVGSTTNLNSTTMGGTWSSANPAIASVSSTGIVSGISAGIATITYSLGTGCARTATVTINALPTAITGTTSVCIGASATLASTPTGGTWTSASGSIATINGATGVLTGVASGTSNITYTISTGCRTMTIVSVNGAPATISGTNTVCTGASTTYTDATSGGSWSSSNTTIATIDAINGYINGITAGTSTITYTVGTGCYRTKTITVNPLPAAIIGTTGICAATMTTLSDATTGGLSWTSSTPSVATINSAGQVNGLTSGTTTITYTLGTGCYTTTEVTVFALPPSITGTTALCAGSTGTLSNSVSGGTWLSNSTAVATIDAVSGEINAIAAGTTLITYTIGTGCYRAISVTVNALPASITGTTSVCPGMTITLSDASGGGNWSSSNTSIATIGSSNGVVTGIVAGTAIVTYTTVAGCATTAVVTVNSAPATITGSTTVCAGTTTTLADVTPGGTWSSSNNSVATIGSLTGIATGVNAGTATITYISGCRTTTVVTVYASPTNISGAMTACVGTSTTLSNTILGGAWSSSDNTIATVGSTGIVTGVSAGFATISYTLPTGCQKMANVTINALPAAISGSLAVCIGTSSSLTDATTGGTWTSGTTAVATVGFTTGILTGATAGTAIISYRATTGCYATAIATVNPAPSAISGTGAICAGNTLLLSSLTTGGIWSSSNTAVATVGTSGVVTGAGAGTATITYMLPTGCKATTIVTINAVAPITGTMVLCGGTNTTLSDATSGGIWSSGTPSVATIGTTNGVVNGLTAGMTDITYTSTVGCRAFATVTVSATPAPITGTTSVCIGSTTSLSSTTTGGAWNSNNTGIATVDAVTGIVSGVTSGATTITYTIAGGCRTTALVSVNALPNAITGTAETCVGSTSTLLDSSPGGTWSSSNTSITTVPPTSGAVMGVAAGTATISYTFASGCARTAIVTVDPLPASITGTMSFCIGNTSSLSSTPTGGTWSSGSTGVASIGSATGVATGVAAGMANITYTIGTGCKTTTTVTVNAAPPAITGTASVCEGSTTTLSNVSGGGAWNSGDNTVATIGTAGDVTGVTAGTAIITYTALGGCSATRTVTVNALPGTILGTLAVCQGATTALSNGAIGGTWSSGSTATATVGLSTGIVTGVAAGMANITYTLGSGCKASTTVTVNPLPGSITGSASICTGNTTTLGSTPTGGTWFSSNTAAATIDANLGIVTGIAAGTSAMTYTSAAGCNTSTVVTVNSLPTAITGTLTVCTGNTTALASTPTGGTWSSSNTAVATVTSSTGIVSGVTSGNAGITYATGAGCITTATITVNAQPAAITGTMVVCAGGVTTLGSTTIGGTWSSSNTTAATIDIANGALTGVSAGTTTVSYSLATGCHATATVTINTLGAITGTGVVCEGATTTLSNTTLGGTWISNDASTATVGITNGVIGGVSAGNTTITYTAPSGCSATTIVTVNAAPTSISGTADVCAGSTTALSSTPAGGTWTSSTVASATVDATTGMVSGVSAGTSTISYAIPSGCRATVVVTVNALPALITGNAPVCEGSTVNLGNTTLGGTWSSTNTTVATVGTNGIVTGGTAGNATISYALASGCYRSVVVTVNIAPAAITGSTTVCSGASIALGNTVPGGTWSSNNPTVATVNTTGVVTGGTAGVATITYTIGNCKATLSVTVTSAAAAITGTAKACIGNTSALSHSVPGGVWTSSAPAVGTVDAVTGVVTALTTGNTTITYTTGAGCAAAVVFTVNPNPTLSGILSTCVGSATLLTPSLVGGTWLPLSGVVSVNSMGNVTGNSIGNANVTYTMPTGCVAIANVTVNGAPAAIGGPSIACVGMSITLTNTVSGGTWSSTSGAVSVGSATGIVTGISTGIPQITYSTGGNCKVYKSVTVNASPGTITGNGGSGYVCVGTSSLFTLSGSGTWMSSSPLIGSIANPSSGSVTGVNPGTTTITYTSSGSSCAATLVVTVVTTPGPISGPSSLCGNETATMTIPSTIGTWSIGPIGTIGSATGIVTTSTTSGNTIITYTVNPACKINKSLSINALPSTFGGIPASICQGASTTLTNVTAGCTWSSSNTAVATAGSIAPSAGNGLVTGISAGTAIISYTKTTTGCTRTTIVTVNPLPNAGTISSSAGSFALNLATLPSVTLSSSGDAGGAWTSSNTSVAAIDAGGVITATTAGSTTVSYTVTLGSCTARATQLITVTTSRPGGNSPVADNTPTQVLVYPNPTTGSFAINTEDAGTLHVFTLEGKEVTTYPVQVGETMILLPKDLAVGVYMCRFNGNNGSAVIIRLVYER